MSHLRKATVTELGLEPRLCDWWPCPYLPHHTTMTVLQNGPNINCNLLQIKASILLFSTPEKGRNDLQILK